MNLSLISLEIGVALLGVLVLLAGLWTPPHRRPVLGFCTALGLTVLLALLVKQGIPTNPLTDSSGGYVRDGLAIFFKALFVLAGILVTLLTMGFANRLRTGGAEVYWQPVQALENRGKNSSDSLSARTLAAGAFSCP